jgi:hypothetical protein
MDDVIRVAPADPGHGALVAQQGVHPAGVAALEDEGGEVVGEGIGPEDRQRALLALLEQPPARLALGPVLLEEHGPVGVEPEAHDRTLGPGLLGRVLDVHPAALGEVEQQPGPGSASPALTGPLGPGEIHNDELSPAPDRSHLPAHQ